MNDRFWELVEQADDEGGDDPDIRDEVFAKLIIKECADVVNSRDDSDTGFWANLIKKHFGVE